MISVHLSIRESEMFVLWDTRSGWDAGLTSNQYAYTGDAKCIMPLGLISRSFVHLLQACHWTTCVDSVWR